MFRNAPVVLYALLLIWSAGHVLADGTSTCSAMIKDGRANGATMQDCLCMYDSADRLLDDDIKVLMFKSWKYGVPTMHEIQKLPDQGRVLRQLKASQKAIKRDCPNLPF